MMVLRSGTDALIAAFGQVWAAIFNAMPVILAAIIFLFVGLLIARVMEFGARKIVSLLNLDALLRKLGVDRWLEKGGIVIDSAKFFGRLVWWIIFFVFITVVADMLGLVTLSGFVQAALSWVFTKLIAAVLIIFVTAIIAQFLRKIVTASVLAAKIHAGSILGELTWWAVIIFGLYASMSQIGIETALLENVLMSFISVIPISIGLAVGLSFGLGGKKRAEEFLDKMVEKFEK